MKKYFWLMLVGLLIVAFSATSYAVDLKAGGYIRFDSFLTKNDIGGTGGDPINGEGGLYGPVAADLQPDGGAFNRSTSWMKGRARIKFDFVADKNLMGRVQFEMDSSKWGEGDGTRNSMGFWGADRASVEIKNAYIQVGLPYFGIPAPMTMTIGLQGISVRKGLVLDNDGMGIVVGIKADPLTIVPFWAKPFEGNEGTADDNDLYGLDVTAKFDEISVGAFGVYFNMNTYPNVSGKPAAYGKRTSDYTSDMFWYGVYSDGKIGPFGYNAELVFDTGTVDYVGDTAGVKDVDYNGWVTRIKVKYPWEKFEFGTTFMYASGADQKKTDWDGLPGTNHTPWGGTNKKVTTYVGVPGDFGSIAEGFILSDNEDLAVEQYGTSAANTVGGIKNSGSFSRGTVGGTWLARLYMKYPLTPWYKIHLQAMYVGDTTKNGNTYGTARTAAGNPRDDNSVGWELGLLNSFQIYKNLSFFVGGGYVFAGDGMDLWSAAKGKNVSPDNPWLFATRLLYEF